MSTETKQRPSRKRQSNGESSRPSASFFSDPLRLTSMVAPLDLSGESLQALDLPFPWRGASGRVCITCMFTKGRTSLPRGCPGPDPRVPRLQFVRQTDLPLSPEGRPGQVSPD